MIRPFILSEYQSLPRGDGPCSIPNIMADRLVAVAKAFSFAGRGEGGVLEDHRHELRARGVVGVIAAEDCSLEILPKIDVLGAVGSDQEEGRIRKRLIHMLSIALDLKIETGLVTNLDWQNETLLEILIRIFCEKLTAVVRRGIPRRYIAHEDDLPVLRGTLDAQRQFTRHAINPSRLACRFDELSTDIALNRIMKAVLAHLSRFSRSIANLQRLRELTFIYADISDVPASALRWDEVVIDRTSRGWQDLYGLAKMFLRNQFQNTSAGAVKGTALLFEMNKLFEEYIGRLITRAVLGTEYRVSLQVPGAYCLTHNDNSKKFQTKPDVLIYRGNKVIQVIDTKWKRISSVIDDRKQGVSQSDVYQMMAYAHLYRAPRLTLLYPHHCGLSRTDGVHARFWITGQDTELEIASIDVASSTDSGIVARLQTMIVPSLGMLPLFQQSSR